MGAQTSPLLEFHGVNGTPEVPTLEQALGDTAIPLDVLIAQDRTNRATSCLETITNALAAYRCRIDIGRDTVMNPDTGAERTKYRIEVTAL